MRILPALSVLRGCALWILVYFLRSVLAVFWPLVLLFILRALLIPWLFAGHDPTRGPGQGGFKMSRVGLGQFSKSRWSGRVGSGHIF